LQGLQGLQGTGGFQGTQGSLSNFQGTQGLQGLQGGGGFQGTQGSLSNFQGTQGIQGAIGSQGSQGLQGAQGLQGRQGTQGLSNQGTQGTQGVQGRRGLSGGNDELIDATHVGIATTSTYYPVFIAGVGPQQAYITTNANYLNYNPTSGTLTAIDFNSVSDEKLKTNVKSISNSIEILKQLNPVSFDWRMESVTSKKSYGLIAQELEQILPELVHEHDGFKSVKYTQIISFLINAVCELDSHRQTTEAEICDLKKALDNLT
jgi:hypothetical protein